MLVRLLVEIDMFSIFPITDWKKKQYSLILSAMHESYLMKCLHINITQNDTIW